MSQSKSEKNRRKFSLKGKELLLLHCSFLCDYFSWFFETATLFSPNILTQVVCNMLGVACVVFQLDMVVDTDVHSLKNSEMGFDISKNFSNSSTLTSASGFY